MPSLRFLAAAITIGGLGLSEPGCAGTGAGAGVNGTYTSAEDNNPLTMELTSGGGVVMTVPGVGASKGTYTVDGEKIIVTVEGQAHTLIRDGNCVRDQLLVFGKMCKGGKAGGASNVSTRQVPVTPTGTWVATNADGQFRIVFGAGNTLTLTATPTSGQADTRDGIYKVEGDEVYATLAQGEPLVLKFVNDAYESTSFGPLMRFVKQ